MAWLTVAGPGWTSCAPSSLPIPTPPRRAFPTGELRLVARAFASVDVPVPGLALSARWERNWCLGTMGQVARREGDPVLLDGFGYGL